MCNASSEKLLNDLAVKHCLAHDALHMPRLHPPVPDTLAGQRVRLEAWWDIYDNITSPFMASDVGNLRNSCMRRVSLELCVHLDSLGDWWISQYLHVLSLQLLLELRLQYRTQNAAARIPLPVTADQDHDLLNLPAALELPLPFRLPFQYVFLCSCEHIV